MLFANPCRAQPRGPFGAQKSRFRYRSESPAGYDLWLSESFATVCALFWGFCGYIGFDLVSGVAKRAVPGYPNADNGGCMWSFRLQ